MSPAARLCGADELKEGHSLGFDQVPGQPAFFILRHQGRAYGYRDACPHYGDTPLAWRKDAYLNADGSRIVCAAHGAEFAPDTGVCLLGPCLGEKLIPVALDQDADGGLRLAAT
jgi:nitrite reductase/ring-hydroxylating ferredoxin subunit